jgi:hypothetical protein
VKDDMAFTCFSTFFIMQGYRVGRAFYFIPKGTYLVIITRLYSTFLGKPQNIYFYQLFDNFAFSFAEIYQCQCTYNLQLFKQMEMEHPEHKRKKEFYTKDLEELKQSFL